MSDSKNILIINYSFDIGGIEVLLLNICKVYDKSRFKIAVCSFKEENALEEEFRRAGIEFYTLKKLQGIDLTLIYKLRKLYKVLDIDIVHTHNAAQWVYGALSCAGLKKPVVVHTQHSSFEKGHKMLLCSLKYLARNTKAVIAVAKYVSDYLVNVARLDERNIRTIHNGINIRNFNLSVDLNKKRSSLGLREQCPVVGIVARLVAIKDHRLLLTAFKEVSRSFPDAQLIIVGDGVLLEELKKYARSLKLEREVLFLGARTDIPEILKLIDIFVLSSLNEGMSITLLEAMAAGLPIIATQVGGNPEVVIHNRTGLLVPSGDPHKLAEAMIYLLSNKDKAMAMGKEGKALAEEKFNIEKTVNEYQALYNSILKNHA